MSKIKGNEAINPIYQGDGQNYGTTSGGLTIRQHFAAMAMQGILSSSKAYTVRSGGDTSENVFKKAECAVEMADALIAELNKEAK